jgi:Protein of unknown function (DUF3187)
MGFKPLLRAGGGAALIVLITGLLAWADFGPLPTANRFPLHLLFLKPRPVKADQVRRGDLEVTLAVEYSNTYFNQKNEHWDVLMDMEMTTLDFSLAYGLTSNVAFQVDMPFVSMSGGFLDGFLENYHRALGTSNYGREERPKNTFAYAVSRDSLPWVQGDSGGLKPTDMTVSTQLRLIDPAAGGKTAAGLVVALKLPVGDTGQGLGSGQIDAGIYLPVGWSPSRWSFYVMPGAALINDPDTLGAHISARNSYSLFCGAAYDYSPSTTWVAQLNYYSSPIEETGLDALDKGALELDLGFHHLMAPGWIVEFAFCEDLTLALPDFNLRVALRRDWTSGRAGGS